MTTTTTLDADLALRDLTDPRSGPHAVQQMIDEILTAVALHCPGEVRVERGTRIVEVKDNYDRLGYGADARARDTRYTRYVDETRMLRSQTSALIPPALRRLAKQLNTAPPLTIACPGVVYRRDAIDRLHTGTPHQMDLWHLTPTTVANPRAALLDLVAAVLGAALPGVPWRTNKANHPYTDDGLEIEAWLPDPRSAEAGSNGRRSAAPGSAGPGIAQPGSAGAGSAGAGGAGAGSAAPGSPQCGIAQPGSAAPGMAQPGSARAASSGAGDAGTGVGGQWVEIGECGLAGRRVLEAAGIPAYLSGLALGLGLDRLVMVRKGVPDIRLLRSDDPRVARQMLDLTPWQPVSAHPSARRDVSVAMPAGVTAEEVGDLVRVSLGDDARLIEEIAIRSVTEPSALPAVARERLGIAPGEVNVLLRVVLRDLDRSIPGEVANDLRDRIYATLHHARTQPTA